MLNTTRSMFDRVEFIRWNCGCCHCGMMTLDVIAKYAFNTGITDVIEIYSMHLGNVTCLALANVTEHDEHPRFSLYLPKLMMG